MATWEEMSKAVKRNEQADDAIRRMIPFFAVFIGLAALYQLYIISITFTIVAMFANWVVEREHTVVHDVPIRG